jgi:hypothetical protein
MLGQNMKENYLTNSDNQASVAIVPMGDASGAAVMIINKSKTTGYSYNLRLDNGALGTGGLQISVNAGINVTNFTGTIAATSTQMLVFCPNGTLLKRYTYTKANADARSGPKIEQLAPDCGPVCNNVPTINTPANVTFDAGIGVQNIALSGISDGDGCTQGVTITATSSNPAVAAVSGITYTSCNPTGSIAVNPLARGTATITVTATDGGEIDCPAAIKSVTFSVTVAQAINLPAIVEAEDFTTMSGIQTETTTDTGGGENIGYTDPGDYLDYLVNVPITGPYTIDFRVASAVATGAIELRNEAGTALATLAPGTTGGWQNWETKTVTATLTAGKQTLRIHYTGAGLNLNWFEVKSSDPILTSIVVTPATASVEEGSAVDFNAKGFDQSGNELPITPIWSVTGGGTITADGLFSATTAGGPFTVKAAVGTVSGNALVTVTPAPVYYPIPGIVQAENYDNMLGIQTQPTTDAGGGENVGWIEAGDWLTYLVDVAETGTYSVKFRVAGWAATGRIALQNSALNTLTAANIPNTGGYQVWATANGEANFTLNAGKQTIRILAVGAPWNFNYFEVSKVEEPVLTTITLTPATATIDKGQTQQFIAVGKDQFGVVMPITPTWSTDGGTVSASGLYSGTTAGNFIVTAMSGIVSGSATIVVKEIPVLTTITVTPATATIDKGQTQQFTAVGKDQFGVAMAITPTWSTTGGIVSTSGLYSGTTAGNFIVTASSGAVSGPAAITVNEIDAFAIPGIIEAEDYDGMFGIQTQPTTDTGGGENIGYVDAGDWLDYNVNVASAGAYNVSFRVASQLATGAFQLKAGAAVLATVAVPNTGGWQNWQTVTVPVTLAQGVQTLRIAATGAGLNINWMNFVVAPTAIKIEAESYTSMFGIQTETTTDAGGGLNVGWTEPGDWMNYTVNVPSTGAYTVNFRVASLVATGKIELRNAAGTALATLTQGSTGGWQTWVTRSATANLTAGSQTLRIYYTGAGLNINWFELVSTGLKSAGGFEESTGIATGKNLKVYPNPATSKVTIETDYSDILSVEVRSLTGAVLVSQPVTTNKTVLDISRLNKGLYLISLQGGAQSITRKLIVE